MHNLSVDAKIIILEISLSTNERSNLTIDKRKRRLPKKNAASKKYLKTNNWICANYKYRVSRKFYKYNLSIFAKKKVNLYNFDYLKTDLSEKFNLNLISILTKASNPDNQDDILYRMSYQKYDTFQSDNFITLNSRDKLWGLILERALSDWWLIRAYNSLNFWLNKEKD